MAVAAPARTGRGLVGALAVGIAAWLIASVADIVWFFAHAELAMRRRHRLRWWLQVAIVPVFVGLTTLTRCLSSDVSSVALGPWRVCGR